MLGSILSGGGSVPSPNSPTGWADLVDGFEYRALATRLQIPLIYGLDTVHGNNNMIGVTVFPHNIGMGATRDPALSELEGEVTAQETRSAGPQWGFAPCICVARDIRWGRTYESFGEDPALVSLMETEINGFQGTNPLDKSGLHILASAKHYAGDGLTTYGTGSSGRIDQGIDQVSRADFERLALAPYLPAVQQYHTGSIMPSYSSVDWTDDGLGNPIKMSANGELLTTILKDTIGFDGFLISDYNALDQIPVPSPNPLPSPLNTNRAYQTMTSINAGMDMVMAPSQPAYKDYENALINLVNAGYVPMSRIDDAVTRILIQKFELGLFDQPFTDRSTQSQIGSVEHRAIARQAAAESQVLLKNSGNILPIGKTARIYLAGSNADNLGNQMGGWTLSWQGGSGSTADGPYGTTIRQAIQNVVGAGNVTYSANASTPRSGNDVGIIVVGETPYAEGNGDVGASGHTTLNLTTADSTAITNVCTDLPCVVLIVSGRPMTLTSTQLSLANAIVASWLPGTEGQGVADILFGDLPFSGRLPQSWPRSLSQEPLNVGDAAYDPLFPFGWGLQTGSSHDRLQQTRDSLAGISGDEHVLNAVALLDELLSADVWNADGSTNNPGKTLQLLAKAAGELANTDSETFAQDNGVFSAALDVAQAAVVSDGGPTATTSALIGNADDELLNGHPDTALTLLAEAAGDALPPVVSNDLASQDVQYSDQVQTVTITATDAATDLPLSATTEWSINGGGFQPDLPSWLALSSVPCTADGVWGACNWTLSGTGPVPVDASSYVVKITVSDGTHTGSTDVTINVKPEDAYLQYSGDVIAPLGTDLKLQTTVMDSAADGYPGSNPETGNVATLGDITKMWIAFDIYPANNCMSGTPTTLYAQVSDTGTPGDGIGTAITTFSSPSENTYCVVSRLVDSSGNMNSWYTAPNAESAVITFYENSGQFVTGGGWINDPAGGKGNFGFNARYNKKGQPQGQMIYVYRGLYDGVLADFVIKSNSLTGLAFSGTTYPINAVLQGKATIQINRASDGVQLYSQGNATFNTTLIDSGQNSSIGSDSFFLMVFDKNAVLFKSVPTSWLEGGNIVIH